MSVYIFELWKGTISDIIESNIILEDVLNKEEYVMDKKEEYISRLTNLKKGINSSKTSFFPHFFISIISFSFNISI